MKKGIPVPGLCGDCKFATASNAMTARNPLAESIILCRWGPPTAQWRSKETYSFPKMNPKDGCWRFEAAP